MSHSSFSGRLVLVFPAVVAWTLHAQSSPFGSGAWSGNVTTTSATASIRVATPGVTVRLAVDTSESLAGGKFFGNLTTSAAAGGAVKIDATGLLPNTDYFYGFEVGGVLQTDANSRGQFRTFPAGAASFTIAFAGDSHYATRDQRAFDAILAAHPALFIHLGDLHYNDTNTVNPDDYRANYDRVLNQPNESALFRGVPLAYMWDDHDAMGNDCDGSFVGVATARSVYHERVPHYPLGPTDGSIGQSFTIGRVRIIMTDTRSAADPAIRPESATKSRLGAVQKAWFKQELLNARDAGFPLILWVEGDPWIDPPRVGADTWAGWATERTEIANFLRDNRIKNLVLLSADMHALAYDDGTHSDYATGGGAPLIVLQSAALTEAGTIKGGPYTAGPLPGPLQYSLLEITDTGGPGVQCLFTGRRVGEGAKLAFQLNASANGIQGRILAVSDPNADHALVNISARGRISVPSETVIVGFVVGGLVPRNLLLRVAGPSLVAFGVADAVPRPVLTLFKDSTVLANNDDWSVGGVTALNAAFDRVGAFHFLNATSQDAAVLTALAPGAYTMQAGSKTGATGTVLVEAYEVP